MLPQSSNLQQRREYLKHIKSSGMHLLELVNDILDLAKIEAGELSLSPETIDCHQLRDECFQLIAADAQARAITLDSEVGNVRNIFADYNRLKRAVQNLLSNGVKYNRAGGRLELKFSDHGAGQVLIEVTDTSPGIATDRFPDLLEPFNRTGATNADVQGRGLGLTFASKFVVAMGGHMGLDSSVGAGSTFWFKLPGETPEQDL